MKRDVELIFLIGCLTAYSYNATAKPLMLLSRYLLTVRM